jgi:predicted nucleic acid-binding protein
VAAGRFERPGTAWHCCLEFYAVATRLPEEFRLTPADAWTLLEGELLARFRIHELPARVRRDFLRGAARDGTRGGRLYDAHIAEIARRSGAHVVLTENPRDFGSLLRQGVRVINAEEMLRQLRKR